jgi:hypothetical protein
MIFRQPSQQLKPGANGALAYALEDLIEHCPYSRAFGLERSIHHRFAKEIWFQSREIWGSVRCIAGVEIGFEAGKLG